MALYIPHSIFQLARLLYVRPETFGSYYVSQSNELYIEHRGFHRTIFVNSVADKEIYNLF